MHDARRRIPDETDTTPTPAAPATTGSGAASGSADPPRADLRNPYVGESHGEGEGGEEEATTNDEMEVDATTNPAMTLDRLLEFEEASK